MSREIKFRAWDKYTNEMIDNVQMLDDFVCEGQRVEEKNFGTLLKDDMYEVMQYTGLKDKTGKEIYEGDILGGDYYSKGVAGKVEFYEDLGAWFLVYTGGGDEFLCKAAKVSESIGNRYENQELLEV